MLRRYISRIVSAFTSDAFAVLAEQVEVARDETRQVQNLLDAVIQHHGRQIYELKKHTGFYAAKLGRSSPDQNGKLNEGLSRMPPAVPTALDREPTSMYGRGQPAPLDKAREQRRAERAERREVRRSREQAADLRARLLDDSPVPLGFIADYDEQIASPPSIHPVDAGRAS